MKIGIVGWGVEGQSAYRYFGPDHEYLIVNEEPRDDFPPESEKVKLQFLKTEKPSGITSNVTDLSYLDGINKCDKVVYSVTAAKNLERIFGEDKDLWRKAVTVQHIFFENVKTKNIIGVTGSKGKGTTSTLIHEMLKAAGLRAYLAGNIGTSVLDILSDVQSDDWVVLELTNYQLYKFPYSPHIAVCLMVTKEHLDWHTDMNEYMSSKTNLFAHQKKDDIAIYFSGNQYSEQIAGASPGNKIPYFAKPGAIAKDEGTVVVGDPEIEVIETEKIKLIGDHNLQNICAALTVLWQIAPNVGAAQQVLSTFSGLPHRMEFVREINNIEYYNDSFGTNPATAKVAMEALVQPIILIAGGYDRGIPLEPLIDEILKDRVRHVITVGQTGEKIAKMLKEKSFENVTAGLKTMSEIVKAATEVAQPGDAVLLSPAAASFDMYRNFEIRGNEFKKAVMAL